MNEVKQKLYKNFPKNLFWVTERKWEIVKLKPTAPGAREEPENGNQVRLEQPALPQLWARAATQLHSTSSFHRIT